MKIQKSAEDYLETMLMLQEERGYIRSIDVADHMGVTKPSVSYATKRLRESVSCPCLVRWEKRNLRAPSVRWAALPLIFRNI